MPVHEHLNRSQEDRRVDEGEPRSARRSFFLPARQFLVVGAACTMISAFVVWLGGQAVGPGQRAIAAETQLRTDLDAFRTKHDLEQATQDAEIRTMKGDIVILITLRCYDVTPAMLRSRGYYTAAKRCEDLRNTGQ